MLALVLSNFSGLSLLGENLNRTPEKGEFDRHRASFDARAAINAVPDLPDPRPRLAEILIGQGIISQSQMDMALTLQRHQDLPVGEILLAHNMISEAQLLHALALQYDTYVLPKAAARADPDLALRLLPAKRAIALNAVPLRRAGSALVVATNRPDRAPAIMDALDYSNPVLLTIVSRSQMQSLLTECYGTQLARRAEARTPGRVSCRDWKTDRARKYWSLAFLAYLLFAIVAPTPAIALIFGVALAISSGNTALKWLALQTDIQAQRHPPGPPPHRRGDAPLPLKRMPVVTILVPLFKERDITGHLIRRLSRLKYPRELLDVLLLIEDVDETTQEAVASADLPGWMRPIIVPVGQPRTKPRAMNYGLNFARGSIIGVYDAEDAPEPDQIAKVADRFLNLPPEVVCLQGQLDYYNPTHNWLSRCFTLEYATWFRLILPGVQRLGLFVPLGGTTLFFRRDVLEEMGAWDAHNVTEDADLGLRLAREGYQTEIIETTTYEEANSAILPWVKQRSRWLKGYAMTWATHMRNPIRLWRELGPKRFIGLQFQVMGAVLGFALAPLLWTLIIKLFGYAHPLDQVFPPKAYFGLVIFFAASQALTFIAVWRGSRLPRHKRLRWWMPLLDLYFLLASVASLLGLLELLTKPFHWRKTAHGHFSKEGQAKIVAKEETADQSVPASSFKRTSNAVDR